LAAADYFFDDDFADYADKWLFFLKYVADYSSLK